MRPLVGVADLIGNERGFFTGNIAGPFVVLRPSTGAACTGSPPVGALATTDLRGTPCWDPVKVSEVD
ncbi:hypothetical protein EST38_g13153 [Candolleomyces aberdarensis]|uniref:Uncharacterized protein n=1 Tax=Candolleomyces aberdarensis TaxID=2316362 RepID=A0A4Q2D2Y5_9AGAR|nr:hypothetical protein EST38_g13153 [Candolleomyces aberdarensis]